MLRCSPKEAEEIWRHIHWSTVLSAGLDRQPGKKQKLVSDYFFSRKGLEQVIKDANVKEKILNVKEPVYAVCTFLPESSIDAIKKAITKALKINTKNEATDEIAKQVSKGIVGSSKKINTIKDVRRMANISRVGKLSRFATPVVENGVGIVAKPVVELAYKYFKRKTLGKAKYFKCNNQSEQIEKIL